MTTTQAGSFEEVLICEIDCGNPTVKFMEEDQIYCDESEDEKTESDIEETEVKTAPAEEVMTSEIETEEHSIQLETEEDQQLCLPQYADDIMTEEEHDGSLKCIVCEINFTCPEILVWHVNNCHGYMAVARAVKVSEGEVNYVCLICNTLCMGLGVIVPHLLWRHQIKNWPFQCDNCDITFMTQQHQMVHKVLCVKNTTLKKQRWKLKTVPVELKRIEETTITINFSKIANAEPRENPQDCRLDNDMEETEVKTEPVEEVMTSEIDIKEHAVKLETEDDQHSLLPQNADMAEPEVKTEPAEFDIIEHPVKVGTEEDQQVFLPLVADVSTQWKGLLECRVLVPKLLECGLCYFYTHSKTELTTHMQSHLVTPGKKRKSRRKLKRSFVCAECGTKYGRPEMLKWHRKNCHGYGASIKIITVNKTQHNYQCEFCKIVYADLHKIMQHLTYRHRMSSLPFHCNRCTNSYMWITRLKKHQLVCHEKPFNFPVKLLKVEQKSVFKCKLCDEVFDNRKEMRKHISDYHAVVKDLLYKCGICYESFNILPRFNSHCDKVHPGQLYILQCPVCKAEFTSHQTYRNHKILAHSDCLITTCICVAKRSQRHVHPHQETLQCNYCMTKFKCDKYLEQHITNLHTFYCKFCTYNSLERDDLTSHLVNCHLQELQFIRNVC